MQNQAPLFSPPDATYIAQERVFQKNIITDRWSKYSALMQWLEVSADPQRTAKMFSHSLRKDSFFSKATHNSYAWRCERSDGLITEWYTDDRERWAGKIILREMQKAKLLNGIIVITRYYGGVKLDADRFRHVVDATQQIISHMGID